MAGRGSRLRPHTLTVPKPLLSVAGKPIVQRLVEDIIKVCRQNVDEIAFIIGDFGEEIERQLIDIANKLGAKGTICYQREPLGTAHAILCAKRILSGKCVVAFADTLFKADFFLDTTKDGIVWVSKIDDPSSFGVVKVNQSNTIIDFIEKPKQFISDLAIIGIYYFKNGKNLRDELQYLIDHNIKDNGEYQLTSALENMKNKGLEFSAGKVDEWMDCGNKNATVTTNERLLFYSGNNISETAKIINAEIIKPCFIGKNVRVENSKVGPYVSLGNNTSVNNSVIDRSLIQDNTTVKNIKLTNSMIGSNVKINRSNLPTQLSLGDFSELE